MGGEVSKPLKGVVPPLKIAAGGFVYLRLPSGSPCPPPPPAAKDLPALFAASRLAAPAGRAGVAFSPAVIRSTIPNAVNNRSIADWTLSGTTFGLHSNAPIGPGSNTPAGAPGCVQTILINGTLKLDSFIGPRTANVATLSENRTMAVLYAVDSNAKAPKGPVVTLTVKDANFGFDISPEKTPGVAMTTATYNGKGNCVAVADLGDAASYIKVRSGIWRLCDCDLGDPVVARALLPGRSALPGLRPGARRARRAQRLLPPAARPGALPPPARLTPSRPPKPRGAPSPNPQVPESSVDWNAKRRLWQPTIMGGEDPNPTPAVVPPEGAPGQCQVAATAAAKGGAAAGAAAAPAGGAAAPAGAKSGARGRGAAAALAAAAAGAALLVVL